MQCGSRDMSSTVKEPQLVQDLSNKTIVEVACGLNGNIALDKTGGVYVWGDNTGVCMYLFHI